MNFKEQLKEDIKIFLNLDSLSVQRKTKNNTIDIIDQK